MREGPYGRNRTPPTSLDACVDQHERVVETVHLARNIEHVSKLSASSPPVTEAIKPSSNGSISQAKPTLSRQDAIEVPAQRTSDRVQGELVEVPNTPTQRSSQLNIPEPMPGLRGDRSEEPDEISMLIDLKSSVKIARMTELCSLCQEKRVLAKRGKANIIW